MSLMVRNLFRVYKSVHKHLMLLIMSECIAAYHLLRLFVQTATVRNMFDVASSGILDKFVGSSVNKRRIHNVISFWGWHSEWYSGLQVHYSFLFSFLFSVLKIGFVHFVHDCVHILRGQLSAGK